MSALLQNTFLRIRLPLRLAQFFALAAICVMIVTAPRIAAEQSLVSANFPPWILPGGIVSLGLALWLAKMPLSSLAYNPDLETRFPEPSPRWKSAKRGAIAASVTGMLILVEISARSNSLSVFNGLTHHFQFVLLVACCALLVWAFSDRPLRLWRWRDLSSARRWELLFVGLLALFALVLRLHDLEALRAFVDELNFILPVRRFSEEWNIPLLQPMSSIAAFPLVYPYLQSVAMSLTESALIGLRIPSAIFGALTVPALYFLGKQLIGWHVGLVAALLLATLPVHLQWSRLGMNNVADPLFGVLMFALLMRGVRRGGSWHFALAGVCFGLTQYFYEGGRLAFVGLIGIWFLYLMLVTVWRNLPRRHIAVFLASALIVGGPIYLTLLGMDRPVTARFDQVRLDAELWNGDLGKLVYEYPRLLNAVGLLFTSRPEYALYFAGHYPYIHFYLLPTLLLGLLILLWRWRTPAGSLLLLWILGTILAMTLLLSEINSARLLMIMPAMMLVCALGIVEPLRILVAGQEWALRPVMLSAVIAIAAIQTAFYFDIHIERFNKQHRQREPEQEIAFWARDLPAGTRVYLLNSKWTRGNDLDLMTQTLNPNIKVFSPTALALKARYIDNILFRPADILFVREDASELITALHRRFVLSAPLDWTDHYAPVGVNYLAYRVIGDNSSGP